MAIAPDETLAGNVDPAASPTPKGMVDGEQPAPVHEAAPAVAKPDAQTPIAKLQSQLDRTTTELNTVKAERDTFRTEIEAAKSDVKAEADGAVEEFTRSFEDWVMRAAREGYSAQQIAKHLSDRRTSTTAARSQIENRQKALDGVYNLAETFDPGFAEFLRKLGTDANVTHENLTTWKKRYEELGGKRASAPEAQAVPATATISDGPPTVPQASGAGLPDAPAWKPGLTSRDLLGDFFKATRGQARKLTGSERIASTR